MENRFVALARAGATALVVMSCALLTSLAQAASSADGSYSGRTSQRREISFRIAHGTVRELRYLINDRCPNGKRVVVRAWGFPPLKIVRHRFGGTFTAQAPASATAVVRGTVSGTTVRGVLSDRTRNRTSHRVCTGRATFTLTRRRVVPRRGGS